MKGFCIHLNWQRVVSCNIFGCRICFQKLSRRVLIPFIKETGESLKIKQAAKIHKLNFVSYRSSEFIIRRKFRMSEMYKIKFTLNYMLVSPSHSKPLPYSCSFPSRTSIVATNLFLSPKAIPKRSNKYDYFFSQRAW